MTCCRCKTDKTPEYFNWKNKTKGVRANTCRDCCVAVRRAWYLGHKDSIIQKVGINTARYRKIARDYLNVYLETHPCVDCGESDPVVLEFDHVNGKKLKAISRMVVTGYTMDTINREIKKCEVRCANCHKRRHHKVRVAQKDRAEVS